MKKILSIICFLAFSIFAKSQTDQVVKNVKWEFSGIKMIVNYDLVSLDGKVRTYDVQLDIKIEGTKVLAEQGLSMTDRQTTGNGKQIVWYFTRDGKSEEELNVAGLQVSIIAINPNPPVEKVVIKDIEEMKPPQEEPTPTVKEKVVVSNSTIINSTPKKPSLILPVAVSTVGLTGIVIGLLQEGEAKDLYDVYKTHTVDSSQAEADYTAANDKHLQAQYIGIGGGVLLGTGAYLLFRTIKKRSSDKYSVTPILDDAPLYGSYGGVGVTVQF